MRLLRILLYVAYALSRLKLSAARSADIIKAFPDWSGKVVRRRSAEGANDVPDESRKRQNM